jgi:hypothetical protein
MIDHLSGDHGFCDLLSLHVLSHCNSVAVENYLEFLADAQARRGEAVEVDKGSSKSLLLP